MDQDRPNPFGRMLTAMVTPMKSDGAVDKAGVRAVTEHLLDHGHDGIVANGTTGESATLSHDESIEVVRLVKEIVGDRAAVTAGVGSNDTAHCVQMAQRAADVGADALLIVSPYYNKPTQSGLIAHITKVSEATELPLMLYDIPARTATAYDTDTLIELGRNPRVQAVKDAKAQPWESAKVMAATDLLWFSGNDTDTLGLLALGAVGTVSVVGHVAGKEYAAMIEAIDRGDLGRARELHRQLIPITDALMTLSQGAIMAKAALVELGVIESAFVRLPLIESPAAHLDRMRSALRESGLV